MSFLTPDERAIIARIRRRSRKEWQEFESGLKQARRRNAQRKHRVDAWINEHPEEFADLVRYKRKSAPKLLSEKAAGHLACKLARNFVHDVILADEE
jgi:phytoene dehydrogenase-like protein